MRLPQYLRVLSNSDGSTKLTKKNENTRVRSGASCPARIPAFAASILALWLACSVAFAIDPLQFNDAAEEQRFRALTSELRCVMCQNQSLADSSAGIAADLRREVLDLMRAGKTDEEIKHFLAERYTDFVLYRPPLRPDTVLLWLAPAAVLIAGAVAVAVIVRRRSRDYKASANPPLDPPEEW